MSNENDQPYRPERVLSPRAVERLKEWGESIAEADRKLVVLTAKAVAAAEVAKAHADDPSVPAPIRRALDELDSALTGYLAAADRASGRRAS